MFIPITLVRPPSVIHGDPDCPPLSEGDESDRVMELQFCLIQLGDLRASSIRFHAGKVGRNTAAAIRRVQARHGLLPGPEEQAEAGPEACEVSQQTATVSADADTPSKVTYDQATAVALLRDFMAAQQTAAAVATSDTSGTTPTSTGTTQQRLYVEGQLELLIPYEPLLTGPEFVATTNVLQSAALKAATAGTPADADQPVAAVSAVCREFDDWWMSVQATASAGQVADTRFLENGDVWRELEAKGHKLAPGLSLNLPRGKPAINLPPGLEHSSVGRDLATNWTEWWQQRPYEVLEYMPYVGGEPLGDDVTYDDSMMSNDTPASSRVEWRETSRGLILPGAEWQRAAVAMAHPNATVQPKDPRGRPISWLAPHTHVLSMLHERSASNTAATSPKPQSYAQWTVLDDEGCRIKQKSSAKRRNAAGGGGPWLTSETFQSAPLLKLPRQLNGKGFVNVVRQWYTTAGFTNQVSQCLCAMPKYSPAACCVVLKFSLT